MSFDLEKDGFKVIRNLIDEDHVLILQTYFDMFYRVVQADDEFKKEYTTTPEGGDVANSIAFYSDKLTESIALLYGPAICNNLNLNLSPTYTYARIYEKGNALYPHTDRPSCQVSITAPIIMSDHRASTIYISNYAVKMGTPDRPTTEELFRRGDYTQIDLMPGDALVYSGCTRYHWRKPLESDYLIQFFMHYVITEGKYADLVFDSRPYMGFPSSFKNTTSRINNVQS